MKFRKRGRKGSRKSHPRKKRSVSRKSKGKVVHSAKRSKSYLHRIHCQEQINDPLAANPNVVAMTAALVQSTTHFNLKIGNNQTALGTHDNSTISESIMNGIRSKHLAAQLPLQLNDAAVAIPAFNNSVNIDIQKITITIKTPNTTVNSLVHTSDNNSMIVPMCYYSGHTRSPLTIHVITGKTIAFKPERLSQLDQDAAVGGYQPFHIIGIWPRHLCFFNVSYLSVTVKYTVLHPKFNRGLANR